MTEAPSVSASRLGHLWRALEEPLRNPDRPLPARLAQAAVTWSGARAGVLYLREKEAWVRSAVAGVSPWEGLDLPDPSLEVPTHRGGILWVPLSAEGEVHGHLGLDGVGPEESAELGAFLGFVLGGLLGAHRLSRLVKEADFEVRTRLVELESLYDLGLSLVGAAGYRGARRRGPLPLHFLDRRGQGQRSFSFTRMGGRCSSAISADRFFPRRTLLRGSCRRARP